MARTRYLYANGLKIAQVKDGVRTDYLTDALGSVTATKNQSQQVVNTYRYKPYGGLLAKTGTGEDPRYLWTGNTGSRTTFTRFANQYNVHRHYANGPAAWTTVDPLWPGEWGYNFSHSSPTVFRDPYGTQAQPVPAPRTGPPLTIVPGGRPYGAPIPGQRGIPMPPSNTPPTPMLDPGDTIGWSIHGVVCLFNDVRNWIWPSPKPTPKPNPILVPPPRRIGWSHSRCKYTYDRYKEVCGDGGKACNAKMGCDEILKRQGQQAECGALRFMVFQECDLYPPKDWRPNICGHLHEACAAIGRACSCTACGSSCNANNPNMTTCYQFQNICMEGRKRCSEAGFKGNKWWDRFFPGCVG